MDLADQLPDTEAFRKRLGARSVDHRDREGWIWVDLEVSDGGMRVLVAEDLCPFDLPYTADIFEARGYGHARGGWATAASGARGPRYPGGGSVRPTSSVVTATAVSSTADPLPPSASAAPSPGNSLGSHIVSLYRVGHRHIPDAAFDQLDHVPSARVFQGLARVAACDPKELRGHTTGVVPQSGRPHSGGLPDRAPGILFKDPGSKRRDAHTQLVWAAKTSRKHDTAL